MRLIDADALMKSVEEQGKKAVSSATDGREIIAIAQYVRAILQFVRSAPTIDALPKVEMNVFDKEEIFENCTVQVLTNSVTGETSIGWWENENSVD